MKKMFIMAVVAIATSLSAQAQQPKQTKTPTPPRPLPIVNMPGNIPATNTGEQPNNSDSVLKKASAPAMGTAPKRIPVTSSAPKSR